MNTTLRRDVQRLLKPLDPVTGAPLSTPAAREDMLRRILVHPVPVRAARRRGARRLMIAGSAFAALVLVAVIGYLVVPIPEPAHAVTPAPLTAINGGGSATQRLLLIAGRTAASSLPRRSGTDEHLVTRSWSLWTQVDGERARSAILPDRTESWRRPDNSGLITKRFEPPQFPPGSSRLLWLLHGAPGRSGDPSTDNYPAGKFSALWPGQPPVAGLDDWLAIGHPRSNGPAETLVAVTDLARERVLSAPVRAEILRIVAALPGLTYDGTVTDRSGRAGQAFSLESDHSGLPMKYTLIVDADAGVLFGFEQMLTTHAGRLDVKVPAVISYDSFAVAEFGTAPH